MKALWTKDGVVPAPKDTNKLGQRAGTRCAACGSRRVLFGGGLHEGGFPGDDSVWCLCEFPWKESDMLVPGYCADQSCECNTPPVGEVEVER